MLLLVCVNLWSGQVFADAVKRAVVWDGVHFVRICQCGYEFDHQIAFLPLWPLAMRTAAKGLRILLSVVARWALVELDFFGPALTCAISGIALSNMFFVLSSVSLFRLAKRYVTLLFIFIFIFIGWQVRSRCSLTSHLTPFVRNSCLFCHNFLTL